MSARERFTVSGPGVEGHPAPCLGAGVSGAQTFAGRHRRDQGEVSFYVRDAAGVAAAVVTKTEGGVIETRLVGEE